MRERSELRAPAILDVVVDLIESGGYDSVQVRTVAGRARVSLATIYKLFGTRDQLIAAAVERWMEANAYAELEIPTPDRSPYEIMDGVLRAVFEPWERHPRMLEAHYRLRSGPMGERLNAQGKALTGPLLETALRDADPDYVSDLQLIFCHLHRGVMARFVAGEIEVTEILPVLERSLRRLTADSGLQTGRRPPAEGNAGEPRAGRAKKPGVAPSKRRRSA